MPRHNIPHKIQKRFNNNKDFRKFENNRHWHLVIHQVTATSIQVWVGVLDRNQAKLDNLRLGIFDKNEQLVSKCDIKKTDWQRPFERLNNRFYYLHSFTKLTPLCEYDIALYPILEDPSTPEFNSYRLAFGTAKTLATALKDYGNDGLTIASGSCFYVDEDGGAVSNAFKALYLSNKKSSPDFKFLTGDQVYLDIGLDSLSPIPAEIRDRIASDYKDNWRALKGILSHGGTWMLADDHEYWNNFPSTKEFNPFLLALKLDHVEKVWSETAISAVERVQQVKPFRRFKIGYDLDFAIADLRTSRVPKEDENQEALADPVIIHQLVDWINSLSSPGILVLPQPLIVAKPDDEDTNLATFENDYRQIVEAIDAAQHDLLLLTGDVHYGCVRSTQLSSEKRLIEVVSSPLSNLSGISSIATDYIDEDKLQDEDYASLNQFPPANITAIPPRDVEYHKFVSSEDKLWDLRYICPKTKEHFSTINFRKESNGKVKISIMPWLVRETDAEGLPKKDWDSPVEFTLE